MTTAPSTPPPVPPLRRALTHGVTLFVVFAFVKLTLAIERHGAEALIPTPTLAEWLVRDAIVAALWGAFVGSMIRVSRRYARAADVLTRVILALLAVYTAMNIAFFRSFSTPLNRGMMGMAGGMLDLGESAAQFVTFNNTWPILVVLVVAVGLPLAMDRTSARRTHRIGGAVGVLAIVIGLVAALGLSTEDPRGLDRNAVWEAALLGLPETNAVVARASSNPLVGEPIPRGSLVEPGATTADYSHLHGAADDMNLVFVVMESTGAEYLGLYGAERDAMPNVSRIAEQALVFDNWYTVTPASMKSMFATFCSTWPYPRPTAESYLTPDLPCHSLPELLALAGLRSTFVHSGKFSFTKKDAFLESRGFDSLWDMRSLPQTEDHYSDAWGIEEEVALAQIERFLDETGDDRFFLAYYPIFPHYPYHLPPDVEPAFGDATAKQRYLSAMHYADGAIGQLQAMLAERDLLDNTLLVLVGDHGEAFRQHPGNAIHSTNVFEENVHVPAIIANPRLFPTQERTDVIADHTSWAPTLLDLFGMEAPERWQGHSSFDGERHMAHFFTDYAFLYLGLRDGPYKFIHQVQTGRTELYDLSQDPRERMNLAGQHPELVAQYVAHMDHWYARQLALYADYDAYLAGSLSDGGYARIEDLVPDDVTHGERKTRFGIGVDHKPLTIDGRLYTSGMGMHSTSSTVYRLDGGYARITGLVGHSDEGRNGILVAELWVDGIRVFESGPMLKGTTPAAFDLSLQGARTLELRVTDGGDGARGDHAAWVDTRLTHAEEAAP